MASVDELYVNVIVVLVDVFWFWAEPFDLVLHSINIGLQPFLETVSTTPFTFNLLPTIFVKNHPG